MTALTLGCIGLGAMGAGMVRGLTVHGQLRLIGHDHTRAKLDALNAGADRVAWAESPEALAEAADVILLAIKPHQVSAVLEQIRPWLSDAKIVLSLAAAVPLSTLSSAVSGLCPVARLMPNLPVLAGKGVFALCLDDPLLTPKQKRLLDDLVRPLGLTLILPEDKFPAFTALAGCGPAYACLIMEGMQNAAITLGFSAAVAKELVAATVEGSARLALEDPASFADLRTRVCSPGGVTIHAVNYLERQAVRGHMADAVLAAFRRDREMTGK